MSGGLMTCRAPGPDRRQYCADTASGAEKRSKTTSDDLAPRVAPWRMSGLDTRAVEAARACGKVMVVLLRLSGRRSGHNGQGAAVARPSRRAGSRGAPPLAAA